MCKSSVAKINRTVEENVKKSLLSINEAGATRYSRALV
jgi:hypothetical protein